MAGVIVMSLTASGCALSPGKVPGLVDNPAARPLVVTTTAGPVRGVATPDGQAFLGVPFAAPPVGPLRFKPPAPPTPWVQPRDATRPGPGCLQPSIGKGQVSEDCLTLNVYAPSDASSAQVRQRRPVPVMVWLYGGGFALGDNTQYDPSRLAQRQGVIVVAPNYRLGAFGFLAHPALKGDGEGAYALQDQQAALRWVRDNIARFGGDPANVTLFGESAGAWSVCYQLTAPGARGLFHKAILQSGSCTSPNSAIPLAEAEAGGARMAAKLGCDDPATAAACLRALPAERLRKAKAGRRGILGADSWAPAYGTDALPAQPRAAFAAGRSAAVPVINGSNRDEGRLFLNLERLTGKVWTRAGYEKEIGAFFGADAPAILARYQPLAAASFGDAFAQIMTDGVFACPARTLDRLLAARGPGSSAVWAYEFDDPHAPYALPRAPFSGPTRAFHSAEIAYVFQTRWAVSDPARWAPAQQALSERIQGHWGRFAASGDPGWPDVAKAGGPVRLAPDSAEGVAADFDEEHRCGFWRGIGY
jgi:para-nitrobenzyl esterase